MRTHSEKWNKKQLYVVVSVTFFIIALVVFFGLKLEYIGVKDKWKDPLEEFSGFICASYSIHALYFWFIKKEEKNEILEAIGDTKKEVKELFRGTSKWGLIRFYDKFDFNRFLNQVQNGDQLYWLDAYLPYIDNLRESILNVINKKVKIKILLMDPGNETIQWRCKEIDDSYYAIENNYRKGIKHAIKVIESLIAANGKDYLEYRKYLGLPGNPVLVIVDKNNVVSSYTGFFLNKLSDNFIYMQWRSEKDNGGMATIFKEYFEKKWALSTESDMKSVGGRYKYKMIAKDISGWNAEGECEIEQEGKNLQIKGFRNTVNGKPIENAIHWYSNKAQICEEDNIRFDYNMLISSMKSGLPAFCQLKIENDQLVGRYFLLEDARPDKRTSEFGNVTFTKID